MTCVMLNIRSNYYEDLSVNWKQVQLQKTTPGGESVDFSCVGSVIGCYMNELKYSDVDLGILEEGSTLTSER